ncbi:hypothetical protein TEHN7126_2358 [Tetragenococcus halophilus subsp. halophilus]|uniref:hypothetical protein n=1 Tax=Tetragenococcus halophilus TaxID=51669 RepID=UPI000CBCAF8F|nr:hypothetical protein [Tetragenococcus halophilus]GBD74103.1 hypothetical protein TEHN7125_2263 [Tetragenococcus halophilus subsp. halophilus]GBD76659.1 hypothetical protein TEHN7126_2358 [Tetragenococcus halophilus subsp. halophilus]
MSESIKDIEVGVKVNGIDEALEKVREYERLLSEAQSIAKELKKTKFKVEFDYGE